MCIATQDIHAEGWRAMGQLPLKGLAIGSLAAPGTSQAAGPLFTVCLCQLPSQLEGLSLLNASLRCCGCQGERLALTSALCLDIHALFQTSACHLPVTLMHQSDKSAYVSQVASVTFPAAFLTP